ncbi:MAG: Rpn family recombination-promoting nuclease/putative transposase, partial [Azoarcus sp.]|nr:Rpn family recombination-promoting nuclease/putative transposase [Azoarcus sp.]
MQALRRAYNPPIQKETPDMELFSPKEDLVFKLLFGDARHIDILTAFLQAVLPLDEDEYEEVSLLSPTLSTEYPLDKLSILDVKVRT